MPTNTIGFFSKYRRSCEKKFGKVCIPKLDSENGIPGENIVLMFVLERPGRLGTGLTDIIGFHKNSDPTARRAKRLFNTLGIPRKKIIVTNACIFYPLRKAYRDVVPNRKEEIFSIKILEDQIKRIKPKIIVPLGNTALRMLKKLYSKSSFLSRFKLKAHIGKPIVGHPPIFPLYHTSNRAAKTRREIDQKKDWKLLKQFVSTVQSS